MINMYNKFQWDRKGEKPIKIGANKVSGKKDTVLGSFYVKFKQS